MRFNDGFGDGQAHSGALHQVALIFTAIEFFEDEALLKIVNAGASVSDTGDDKITRQFGSDGDGLRRG